MKRIIGAAIVLVAMQAAFATASAQESRRDRDDRYERDDDRDRSDRDDDRRDRDRDRRERDRERDRERSRSYFFAGGGTINGHDIEYDIPGGEVEIQAEEGDVWTLGWARQWGNRLHSETTFTYSEQDIDTVRRTDGPIAIITTPESDVQVFTVAWMNYIDFGDRGGLLHPYLGFGLGLSNVDLNDGIESGAGLAVSGRLSAGLRLAILDHINLFGELRYDGHLKDIDDGFGFSGNNSVLYMSGESAVAGLKFGF